MEEDKVICKICDKEFESHLGLTKHIKPAHYISSKDYYDKYHKEENDGLCLVCSKPTRFVNFVDGYKKYCSNDCHNIFKKIQLDIRDKFIYEEKLENEIIVFDCKICGYKIFNNMKGIGSHLKHQHQMSISKYYDNFYLETPEDKICKQCGKTNNFCGIDRGYSKHCSKSCSNKDEINIIARTKGINKKEVKEKQSRSLSQRILDGTFKPFGKNFKTGYFFSNKNQRDYYYRSSYELLAYQKLELLPEVKTYDVEPFKIPYTDTKGIVRNYIPDILINYDEGLKELIEVKPENLLKDEIVQIKIESARQYYKDNGMNFNIWTEKYLEL